MAENGGVCGLDRESYVADLRHKVAKAGATALCQRSMTQAPPAKPRTGRPLPRPDPDALRRAHRLSGMAEVGALLRAERAVRGLSQASMAARLGMSRQQLVALEGGAEGVAAGTLLRILADLGIVVLALPAQAAADPARALGLGSLPS